MMTRSPNSLFWTQHAPIDRVPGEVIGSGTDRDINGEGVAYAHRLARGLGKLLERGRLEGWSGEVVTSSLQRAISTSQIVAEYLSCDLIIDERTHAQHFGVLEGMTFSQIQTDERLAPHLHEFLDDEALYEDRAPGGESIKDATTRLMAARAYYIYEYSAGNPVIITHGSMLNAIIGRTLKLQTRQTMNINKRYRGLLLHDTVDAEELITIPVAQPGHW